MTKIGFIGLGHMGLPMVKHLLNGSHQVNVFDLSDDALARAVSLGAITSKGPAEIAQQCDVIFTMLQTGEQVASTCLGEQGLFANAKSNALYIDSSSMDIYQCREIHHMAQQHHIAMLDAPVSGGVAGAEAASLTIMVGGELNDFEKAKPFLSLLGKNIIHAGPAGNGQAAKICNNMILGISMIAISEAYTLAEKLGLDAQTFHDISTNASGQCWAMSNYSPVPGILKNAPASHQYQPGFTAHMMLKDLLLSQSAADHAHVSTKLGALATEIYKAFNAVDDQKSLDFSAIIQSIDK